MEPVTMARAINLSLRDALTRDPDVLIFGEDVGTLGGVFRITDGLQKAFGEERVFDTPLAESDGDADDRGLGQRRVEDALFAKRLL